MIVPSSHWSLQEQVGRLVVVLRAANVVVVRSRSITVQLKRWLLIESVPQDRFQARIRVDSQQQRSLASCLQPLCGESFRQAENAQAGPVSGFWMRLALQDGPHHFGRCRSDRSRPVDQARGSPFQMRLMTLGPMLVNGGSGIRDEAAWMRGNPHATVEDFHGGGGVAGLQLLSHELI